MIKSTLFVLSNLVIIALLSVEVPDPYMDEPFHVAQYMRIKDGRFEYDPAITTFPGLYYFTCLLGPFVNQSLELLRSVNAILGNIGLIAVSYAISGSELTSVLLTSMPLNWFYSLMYYTDTLSTLSVLGTYWLLKGEKFALSGLAGMVAVSMRQTNIVWIFGFCVDSLIRSKIFFARIQQLWLHVVTGIAFTIFFILNDFSVVLGHSEFHSFSFHSAQMNYLVLVWVGLSGPSQWYNAFWNISKLLKTQKKNLLLTFVISVWASEFGTIFHPFILSDNRHYSFYFARYILSRRVIRSVLIPLVVSIAFNTPSFWSCGIEKRIFVFCCAVTLILTPLLEFRYFNVALSLLILNCKTARPSLTLYWIINMVTISIFLYRPFGENSSSRFMY
jgi:alpha-1,2-glucosyltransferase